MDLELCQLDRRYEALRSRSTQRERRLLSSLSEVGQQLPIVVVRDAEHWVVVDGYKRLRALRRLGHDVVRAAEWTLQEADALLLERVLRMGDADSPLEQGWFLLELTQRFGLGLEELARRLDRSKSWVSRRVGLVKDLPQSVQEHVRRGSIGAHAAMKYLLPLARANAADCAQISAAIAPERPTSRELGELYATYMAGNSATRELVVNKPQVVLRARAASTITERGYGASGATPVEHVVEDLRIVAAVAHRARGRLVRGAVDGATPEERDRVQQGVGEAGDAVRRLEAACRRELRAEKSDVGSSDASNDPATP
jgi:ParB family transcriptional regulator, chromosome partitioning protein